MPGATGRSRSSRMTSRVFHTGQPIGMGRVVGDGAIFFYLQDIAVVPEHQGCGVGARIVDRLIAYLSSAAPERAFVGLFAAAGKQPFYERYGFRAHSALTGMFQVAPIEEIGE